MKIPIEAQEILAQLKNNQVQIDLLTRNNTLLMDYLLTQGIRASHQEFVLDAEPPKLLEAPKRKGAASKKKSGITNAMDGRISIVEHANQHNGVLDLYAWRMATGTTGRDSFSRSGVYAILKDLTRDKILQKITPGRYKLIGRL